MVEKPDITQLDNLVGAAESASMAYHMMAFSKSCSRASKSTYATEAGVAADRVSVWLLNHEPVGKLSRECWSRRATRYYVIAGEWAKGEEKRNPFDR
jgi:hypothetical protein